MKHSCYIFHCFGIKMVGPVTWVISKNKLPKLGVIIERRLLLLATYLNVNMTMWTSEMTLFRELSNIYTSINIANVNSKILTFGQYPKVSRLILFSCVKLVIGFLTLILGKFVDRFNYSEIGLSEVYYIKYQLNGGQMCWKQQI